MLCLSKYVIRRLIQTIRMPSNNRYIISHHKIALQNSTRSNCSIIHLKSHQNQEAFSINLSSTRGTGQGSQGPAPALGLRWRQRIGVAPGAQKRVGACRMPD